VEPPGVVAVGVGGVLVESGGLSDAFGEVFCEVADVASSFFGTAEDALDVYLRAEPDDVCGFGQLFTRLLPGRQRCPTVGVGEGLFTGIPHWSRSPL
jgi:hypothetical protein